MPSWQRVARSQRARAGFVYPQCTVKPDVEAELQRDPESDGFGSPGNRWLSLQRMCVAMHISICILLCDDAW